MKTYLRFVLKMGYCLTFDVLGSVHRKRISNATNKIQRYTIYLFLWNALHFSGGSSAHHQELKLYIQHRVLWQSSRCCIYSFWAPDDGRRNRLKPAEHFTEINKLCNVASCWLHLKKRDTISYLLHFASLLFISFSLLSTAFTSVSFAFHSLARYPFLHLPFLFLSKVKCYKPTSAPQSFSTSFLI